MQKEAVCECRRSGEVTLKLYSWKVQSPEAGAAESLKVGGSGIDQAVIL